MAVGLYTLLCAGDVYQCCAHCSSYPFPPSLQVGLGISTLLLYVPTPLAATHQSGSLALLSMALWLMSELRRLPK